MLDTLFGKKKMPEEIARAIAELDWNIQPGTGYPGPAFQTECLKALVFLPTLHKSIKIEIQSLVAIAHLPKTKPGLFKNSCASLKEKLEKINVPS